MDVWFDSGSSWAAVAQLRPELKYPVDMYLEGSDQHRGWFQSSLLTSVAVNGVAPYKTVLTHGFVLDEKGHKMSKSVGNVVDPNQIINGGKNQQKEPAYGADVLRLWVSSVDYNADVPIGQTILKQLMDARNKIRNTARFLLGNLHDFNPETDALSYDDLPELDRYMLHRITEVFEEVTEAYENFQFFKFFQTVQNFCVVDLSNFYLDIAKDRLYISDANSPRRRSCQTILQIALENLTKAIAPVLSHLAEDIWQFLPYKTPYKSVFEAGWVTLDPKWKFTSEKELNQQPQLNEQWMGLRELRDGINKLLEQARSNKLIGSSLEAQVLIYDDRSDASYEVNLFDGFLLTRLENFNQAESHEIQLRYLFLVSQVKLTKSLANYDSALYKGTVSINWPRILDMPRNLRVAILKADGHKCDRCWNYSLSVGTFAEDPTICDRCEAALKGEF
jgi:isoleucyl-tRNA synthetase